MNDVHGTEQCSKSFSIHGVVGNRHSRMVRRLRSSRYPGGSRLVGVLVLYVQVVCPVRTGDHTASWSTGFQVTTTDENYAAGKGMYVRSYYQSRVN